MKSKKETVSNSEDQAALAFSKQAVIFDAIYAGNTIVQYKRDRVRQHMLRYLGPGNSILELNSGTGEDAIWFAQQGYKVHATDIAAGMQEVLKEKVGRNNVQQLVTTELCSFNELDNLKARGPYDHIFSNFAGLNCAQHLDRVLGSLTPLLSPGGKVTLVILPKFCLWELLLLFTGKFKTAFRRFFSGNGRMAHIEGQYFKCWYYNPSYVIKHTAKDFELLSLEGLCTVVPPSYIEHFPQKHPLLFAWLKKKENRWRSRWPWKLIGDYYIISLQKK